ncbi:2'-5' RNA ligase family protein [Cellulomonas denverensis]|uniref:2'-5' RNA ligase family protein n=1 Tax=Cellulomonas denverensis TaxID=264297 RepID=A0A7X6KRV8_9CELL|nr:2'-5' RNA ligase family protein [Cellulomonas denverensis]NKY21117.1 2'-5' RNA ligase family protein [Cellulomonas denverensis]GIG26065.1 phosphoesterase [Cellulomonas denverensis]
MTDQTQAIPIVRGAPGTVRIGVAVGIPEPWATQLHDARARVGDPAADLIAPHITLLGPTTVHRDELAQVHRHLAAITAEHPPFRVHLRGTASFRPVSPVVFVQVVEGIGPCETLERRIRSGLLAQELRFHYHPHVTIAHEVPDDALDRAFEDLRDFDACFLVESIQVYQHGDDGQWRVLDTHPLTGAHQPVRDAEGGSGS